MLTWAVHARADGDFVPGRHNVCFHDDVDAVSDDGRHALTIIAFVGSVFSAYDHRARQRGGGVAEAEAPCRHQRRAVQPRRTPLADGGAAVVDDVRQSGGRPDRVIAARFAPDGRAEPFEAPRRASLPRSKRWVGRHVCSDAALRPRLVQTLQDTPFYVRSMVETGLLGERVQAMHESLSGSGRAALASGHCRPEPGAPMPVRSLSHVAAALLFAGSVSAAEMSASSAASMASQSLAGSSASLGGSSGASSASSGGGQVADGDYRIERVAAAEGRPGMVQLTLRPVSEGIKGELQLTLPQATFDATRLAAGGTVTARNRAWGIEFAAAARGDAFFLVVADTLMNELPARPVAL